MKNILFLPMLFILIFTGCSSEQDKEQRVPPAVSYVTLRITDPGTNSRITGTVESWKREDIGFEVAGRLLSIVEPGIDIEGRTFDEEGKLISEGTVLAELESDR